MFSERMALEATLRRQKLIAEAQAYRRLRPYRRAPRWQKWLLSRLEDWIAAIRAERSAGGAQRAKPEQGTALQRRYRRVEAKVVLRATAERDLALADYTKHGRMERVS